MGINSKIAKIPFIILYLILAGFTSYNWIRVILFQKNYEVFRTAQPWDYYLSNLFTSTFGITQQQYFIFVFPIILVGLYLVPKITGKLISLDKNSNIKGDNHVALIIILLILPGVLDISSFLGSGWRNHLIPGLVLITLFSFWSWIDEKKHKTK